MSAFVCIHITSPLTNLIQTSNGAVCCYFLSKTDTAESVLAEVELHCAGNWVSLTKTNDNNWLGDRLGVTTDTMARKLKLVASFERRQGTQRFPSVHKRDDRYGTPPAAWIYVKKADEDVPELTDWLTNKGDEFRQGQGRRMDRYTCTRSRLQHLSRKQKEAYCSEEEDNEENNPKRRRMLQTTPVSISTPVQPSSASSSSSDSFMSPRITTATMAVAVNQHTPSAAGSTANVEARQIIAEIASVGSALGAEKLHRILLLAGKFFGNRLQLGEVDGLTDEEMNYWLSNVVPSVSKIQRTPAIQLRVELQRKRGRLSAVMVHVSHDHGHRSRLHMLVFLVNYAINVDGRVGTFTVHSELLDNAVVGGTGEEIFEHSKLIVNGLNLTVFASAGWQSSGDGAVANVQSSVRTTADPPARVSSVARVGHVPGYTAWRRCAQIHY